MFCILPPFCKDAVNLTVCVEALEAWRLRRHKAKTRKCHHASSASIPTGRKRRLELAAPDCIGKGCKTEKRE